MEFFKPAVSEEFAKNLVKRIYGLEVLSINRMISYDDQNFHILVSKNHNNSNIDKIADTGYTLKVTNTQKSAIPGHFDSMHSTMFHLNNKGIRVPVPLKNVKGQTWSMERVPLLNEDKNDKAPKLCGVHVLSFIPGVPIPKVECTRKVLFQWGADLAEYHKATEDFDSSLLKGKDVFWNLENIPKIKDYMNGLPDDKNNLIKSVLNRYPAEIETNYHQLPRGAIHGDFNENNVLAQTKMSEDGNTNISVDGVLDFEDIHEGTYTWDVGVMLAYCLLTYNEKDVLEGPGYALAGYLSVRPLNSLEQSLLKMCMECRLCQSLVLCAYSYQQDSNNLYLLESAKTGWTKLKLIGDVSNEELQQKWINLMNNKL